MANIQITNSTFEEVGKDIVNVTEKCEVVLDRVEAKKVGGSIVAVNSGRFQINSIEDVYEFLQLDRSYERNLLYQDFVELQAIKQDNIEKEIKVGFFDRYKAYVLDTSTLAANLITIFSSEAFGRILKIFQQL